VASVDDHPLELAHPLLRISQPTGRDDPGLIERHDLCRLIVAAVHLQHGIDTLLVAEDLDPQVAGRLDLGGIAGGANSDGQTATRVGGIVTSRWTSPWP
jgi:hypothetical protein